MGIKKLQLRRGKLADIPELAIGEPGFATDTGQLLIGTQNGNIVINELGGNLVSHNYLKSILDNTVKGFYVEEGWNLSKIKDYAFYNNVLESINLTHLTEIGERSFYNNTSATSVTFDMALEIIKPYGLYNTPNAVVSEFPKNIQEIGENAFYRLGNHSGQAFDVEFEDAIDVPANAFQEAKIKTLTGELNSIGDSAFRDLGSTLEEVDLKINGAIGSYGLAGNASGMFKFDKNSNITEIGSYAMQNFGVNRPDPSTNRIVLDWRNSTFAELATYSMSGTNTSNRPKHFDLYLPDTVASIGTYAFRYAENFRLFLHSVPALANVNTFNNAQNYKILIDYNLLHITSEPNWSSLADNIIGYAAGMDFGEGFMLPSHSKTSGRALEWFDDVEMTNQVTMVTDEETIYYAREIGEREVYYLRLDVTEADVEVYNIDLDIEYTTSMLVPIGHNIRITKADPIGDATIMAFNLNGVDVDVGDEFEMDQDYTLKVFAFSGTINFNFETAEPIEMQIAANAGLANMFQIGATRDVLLKDGVTTVTFRVADNTNTLIKREDGSYAGLVIEFVQIHQNATMNADRTNAGGWDESRMRVETMEEIFDLLPDEWQAVIATAQIKTANNGTGTINIVTSLDKLWLPAGKELFGVAAGSVTAEANVLEQFKLYADNNENAFRIKQFNNSNAAHWTRSPNSGISTNFVTVTGSGSGNTLDASNSYGVAPCFAI